MQPYDPESLARAIRRYVEDPDLRLKHGVAARAWVIREFRPEGIWQAVYEVYLEILEEKGIPAPDTGIATPLAGPPKSVGVDSQQLAKTSG